MLAQRRVLKRVHDHEPQNAALAHRQHFRASWLREESRDFARCSAIAFLPTPEVPETPLKTVNIMMTCQNQHKRWKLMPKSLSAEFPHTLSALLSFADRKCCAMHEFPHWERCTAEMLSTFKVGSGL